jgi:hypothetical protein
MGRQAIEYRYRRATPDDEKWPGTGLILADAAVFRDRSAECTGVGIVLDPDDAFVVHFHDAVHQEKWIPVRQDRADVVDVQHGTAYYRTCAEGHDDGEAGEAGEAERR